MAKWLVFAAFCSALLLSACEHSDNRQQVEAEEREPIDAGAGSGGSAAVMTVVSVGGGATPRCEASQCEAEANAFVASLTAPQTSPPTYEGGRCATVSITGVAVGRACSCDGASNSGSATIGPAGAGCFAAGRAGDCLWDDSEYEPCSDQSDKCPELCKELERRYAQDAKATIDAQLRSSSCDAKGMCHWVVRVDDRCLADRSDRQARVFDCSLTDEEIQKQEQQAQDKARDRASCSGEFTDAPNCRHIKPPAPEECVQRPEEEWQGLLVCPPHPPCSASATCGVALACIDGTCNACSSDEQCAPGEGCALDHCMPAAAISCHRRADCKEGELCILNGTSNTVRGNENMRAYCQGSAGGASSRPSP